MIRVGLKGPTSLQEKQLEVAQTEYMIQQHMLQEMKENRMHYLKKVSMRLRLHQIQKLKVFKEICSFFEGKSIQPED